MQAVVEHRTQQCRCGHAQQLHEHYRRGSDCALCGAGCTAFRQAGSRGMPSPVARLVRGLHRHR